MASFLAMNLLGNDEKTGVSSTPGQPLYTIDVKTDIKCKSRMGQLHSAFLCIF
jgi:hypothetical protein